MVFKHYLVFFLLILVSFGAQHHLRQLTQLSSVADDIKNSIFRYIKKIDFRPEANLGGMNITNNTNCVPLIVKQNLTMMSSITYGKGRAIALGSVWLYEQSMLFKDNSWIIFMRNIIAWITKDKQNSQGLPLKILMISSQIKTNFSTTLKRARMYVTVAYEQSVKNMNLSKYDCILIDKIDNKVFGDLDVNNIVQYVRNGGGLFITLKGWVYREYQANNAQDWILTCPYNKITRPMGLYFNDKDKGILQLTFTSNQTFVLEPVVIRGYTRQLNPDYIKNYDSPSIQTLKNDKSFLLNGINQIKFNGVGFSSFLYSRDSYIPLFSHENKDIIVAGRFGLGKLLLFGNIESLQFSRFNSDAQKKLLINSVKWMSGTKTKYVIGSLFDQGYWNIGEKQKPSLLGLGLNTQARIVNNI